jgi:excisionase family DNA binding protein
MITKTILTFSEASEYTGMSKSYLYKLTSTKKISYSKPNGKIIFFEKEDLDKWMMSNKIMSIQDIKERDQFNCNVEGLFRHFVDGELEGKIEPIKKKGKLV